MILFRVRKKKIALIFVVSSLFHQREKKMGLQHGNEAFPTLYLHGVKRTVVSAPSLKCCSQTDSDQMSELHNSSTFTSVRSQSASSALAAAVTGKPNNLER